MSGISTLLFGLIMVSFMQMVLGIALRDEGDTDRETGRESPIK